MPNIKELLQSTTNRLVAVTVMAHVIVSALFAGAPSGLELYAWQNPQFQVWQLGTYMFLHADWLHLGLNMLALWSFGRVLEQAWGGRRFLTFFLICGVGAALVHLAVSNYEYQALLNTITAAGLTDQDISRVVVEGLDISAQFAGVSSENLGQLWGLYNAPAVGASGAVYGVLVAFALLFPGFKVMLIFLPIPISARYFVPVLLLIDLTAGLTGVAIFGQNIAHFAHLGGALMGFLTLQFWLRAHRVRSR